MPTKTKKKGKKKLIIWIVIIIAALIIAAILIFIPKGNDGASYESKTAMMGDIKVTVNGSGAIESYDDETIYVKYSSEVKKVVVENGDTLKKGEIIAVLESDSLDIEIKNMQTEISDLETSIRRMDVDASENIKTIAEGRIKEIFADEDDDIDTIMDAYGALAVISTDDMLKAEVAVKDTMSYTVGNDVVVMIDEDKETATIKKIDQLSSIITVVFEDDKDEDYEIGEVLTISDSSGKIIGEGILELNHPLYVTASGGICDDVKYDINEWVSEGATILTRNGDIYDEDYIDAIDELEQKRLDLNEMEDARDNLVVRAAMDGIISSFNINEGEFLNQGQIICDIKGNSLLKILVEVDELDIAKIKLGQVADVNIDALEDMDFKAKVIEINPLGISVNNVTNYIITLELDSSPGILLGMSAEVDIFAQEAKDAVLVPIEAIQTINNEQYVMMANEIGVLEIAVSG